MEDINDIKSFNSNSNELDELNSFDDFNKSISSEIKVGDKKRLILVDSAVLPEVFEKVIEAKRLLSSGECSSATSATKQVGISRSAYYKYKDYVFPYNKDDDTDIITVQATLRDNPGILSAVLTHFASVKANIMTVNQNIPVNHMAHISISARTDHLVGNVKDFIKSLSEIDGVLNVNVTLSSGVK